MKRPSVLLVDDMPEIVRYCTGILSSDYEIVGTAASGPAAIEAVAATDPDLIVLDISMPGLNGLEVARRLRQEGCRAVIVFLSADDALSEIALEAGGSAYVSKTLIDSYLRLAMADALAGKRCMSFRAGDIDQHKK